MRLSASLVSGLTTCVLLITCTLTLAQGHSGNLPQQTVKQTQQPEVVASLRAAVEAQQKKVEASSAPDARLALSKRLANIELQLTDALATEGLFAAAGQWYARANQLREENYRIEKASLEEQITKLENLSNTKRNDVTLSESDRGNFIKTYNSIIDGLLNLLDELANERGDSLTRTSVAEHRLAAARETKDAATTASALQAKAEVLRRSGDLTAARFTAEEALQFRTNDPQKKFIYDTVRLLAWIANDANDWNEAETRYREVIAMAKPGALPDLFELSAESDDAARRTKIRMNIEDRLNREQTALHARLYLADIEEKKGNYGEAERQYKLIGGEISRLYAFGADDEAELLSLTAAREKPRADLIEALNWQLKAGDIDAHRSAKGTTSTEEESARLKAADLFVKSLRAQLAGKYAALLADEGELDKATQAYRDGIKFFQGALGGSFPVVGLYAALGRVERQRGDFESAEAALKTALQIYQRQHDLSGIASVLSEQSALLLDQQRVAEAKAAAEAALKIARTLGNKTQIAGLLRALGRAESEAGGDQLKSSEQNLREALATWRDLGLRAHTAYTLSSLGLTLERQGRIKEALAAYEEAVKLIEILTGNISNEGGAGVFNSSTGNRELYDRLIRLLLKVGRTTDALGYLERAKSKSLIEALTGTNVRTPNPSLNLLLTDVDRLGDSMRMADTAVAAAAPANKSDPQRFARARAQLADTQQKYLKAVSAIQRANPFYAGLVAVTPTDLVGVRRRLPAKAALIEYFPTDTDLYIFVMTPGRPPLVRTSSISRDELAGLVGEYRRAIAEVADPFSGATSALQDAKRKFWIDDGSESFTKYVAPIKSATNSLYNALIEPIAADINEAQTLLIVPAGELYYLPIHALGRIKPDGDLEFLIERKRLAYLSSADLINVVTGTGPISKVQKPEQRDVLALGNPDGSLEGASEEVEYLRRIFPTTAVYMKEQATLAHLKEAAGHARYLHFATHGFLKPDPKESYLLLAGNPSQLTVRAIIEDAYGLSFAGIDLVTLSACNSNIGGFDPGAKYSSLSRAFAKAGAPSVVASLWQVDDESTRDTMGLFYRELAAGQAKAEALRRAQLTLMHNPKFAHPYFWSAFVLMGDWR